MSVISTAIEKVPTWLASHISHSIKAHHFAKSARKRESHVILPIWLTPLQVRNIAIKENLEHITKISCAFNSL